MDHPRMVVCDTFMVVSVGRKVSMFDQQGKRKDILADPKKPTLKVDIDATGDILAMCLSPSAKYLVVANDYKQVFLMNTHNWDIVRKWTIPKKAMKFVFQRDESVFLMADKLGGVSSFQVADSTTSSAPENPSTLLGRLSMILDVVLIADEKFVVTCDRDEKVCVSHYPNAYNIHRFCLGHESCVTRLVYIQRLDVLASAGADGSLCFWDYRTGHIISSYDCSADFELCPAIVTELLWCDEKSTLVVGCHSSSRLRTYLVTGEEGAVSVSPSVNIDVGTPIWSLSVLRDEVWVLAAAPGPYLSVFDLCGNKVSEVTEGSTVASTWVECASSLSADLEKVKCDEEFYHRLKKCTVDGSESYYKRKQQRLEESSGASVGGAASCQS